MKRYLLYGVTFAALSAVLVTQPSYALLDLVRSETAETRQVIRDTTGEVLNAREDEHDQKRQEIQDRITERRAAVVERLSGERAEACERKEPVINEMLAKKSETAKSYYDRFSAIQTKLNEFVAVHHLDVESASALQLILTEKQEAAATLLDATTSVTFECDLTSADHPGLIVRDLVEQKKQALIEYRDALKEYATAIKEAAAKHDESDHRHSMPRETTESETAQ